MFLDFAKAFDKVCHSKLCYKLSSYGINGEVLSWIKDYLTDRSQTVVLEGKSSSPKPVLSGASQGSVLAPLLFLLYINDIGTKINSTVRLYADDVLIYRTIQSEADGISLQNDLSNLESWANLWQMKFNPAKCLHVVITNKRSYMQNTYQIYGQQILQVTSAKYYRGNY